MLSAKANSHLLEDIREELEQLADPIIRKSSERFFKEPVKTFGLKTSEVSRIAKENFKTIKQFDKNEIFMLCETLWQSGYMEESFIACNWSYMLNGKYEPADFDIFERWVHNYVSNWASCDTLCNHTIGAFIDKYPEYIDKLKTWAKSPNRWVRRAAAVSLIIPARRGRFLVDIFEIANILLLDTDDLVQKGYGWMLKAASESHQMEVFEFVVKHKSIMPRTSLRYAIEKMPKEMRLKAMEK
jgi:3-methyladenine DNA glycosylase AlkD